MTESLEAAVEDLEKRVAFMRKTAQTALDLKTTSFLRDIVNPSQCDHCHGYTMAWDLSRHGAEYWCRECLDEDDERKRTADWP